MFDEGSVNIFVAIATRKVHIVVCPNNAGGFAMAIPVITATLSGKWEVVDAIMAVAAAKSGWVSGPDATAAFEQCKNNMRAQAQALKGDAVISCHFEFRNYDKGIEILGYGTVIKIVENI